MAAISKEEYLKRYLSGPAPEEKKKKKRKKVKPLAARMKIVDDDIDVKQLIPNAAPEVEEVDDEEPTVADFVDERPEHVKQLEQFQQDNRWKRLAADERGSPEGGERRRRYDSDSDQSPRRGIRHDSDSDHSPVRRKRNDSDSDASPVRRRRHDSDSDHSPVRRNRYDSGSDQSPLRRKRLDSDSDQSPVRTGSHNGNSSQRSNNKLRHSKNSHPPEKSAKHKKRSKHNSDSDQSPPRRRKNQSDSDQSPPRRRKNQSDSDQSPPRRRKNQSDSDQSPPRKHRRADSDQSPPRRHKHKEQWSQGQKSKNARSRWSDNSKSSGKEVDTKGRAKETLGGAKAGLSSAKDMREEAIKLKAKENKLFDRMDSKLLGKNAETVFRDKKSGRRRDMSAEREEEEAEAARKAIEDKKYKEWGEGKIQREMREAQLMAAANVATKPLARLRDDKDLDSMLRDQEREGDPMLAFMRKKKAKSSQGAGPTKELPRYRGPEPPPNRFSIWPGYRWDGVDRSNGFENKLFAKAAERKAHKAEAHMWSIEDM